MIWFNFETFAMAFLAYCAFWIFGTILGATVRLIRVRAFARKIAGMGFFCMCHEKFRSAVARANHFGRCHNKASTQVETAVLSTPPGIKPNVGAQGPIVPE